MFKIRTSHKSDLAAVDALLSRAYPKLLKADYAPSVLVTSLPLISRAQPALLECGSYYVAEAWDGRILGAGGWTPDPEQSGLGHIRHVVTDDRQVRKGVGSGLMKHCFGQAQAEGFNRLECWSTITAVSFYSALGFAEIGPMDVQLQPGVSFPAVQMLRLLS
ncbi:MAG: GNAT family N-acetyltransferase [Paracoccaceae bacterium]